MFRVPTYVSRSSIHGFGVFAAAPIACGSVIWELDEGADWVLTEAELGAFPERLREQLEAWTYQEDDGRYVLCSDAAKFMNHSFRPNCDDRGPSTIAARDIEVGEELTCDYRSFDLKSKRNGLPAYRRAAS